MLYIKSSKVTINRIIKTIGIATNMYIIFVQTETRDIRAKTKIKGKIGTPKSIAGLVIPLKRISTCFAIVKTFQLTKEAKAPPIAEAEANKPAPTMIFVISSIGRPWCITLKAT